MRSLSNLLGWNTSYQIIVIESDDWGSERLSKESKAYYNKKGCCVRSNWMSNIDTLETANDLTRLYEVINDSVPRLSIPITLLFNPANPDYEKILQSGYTDYEYRTADRYLDVNALGFYRNWLAQGSLELAYHGREHLAVNRWLRDLRNGVFFALDGFKVRTWGFSKSYIPEFEKSYRSAFVVDNPDTDLLFQRRAIPDGVEIMKNVFGIIPRYFVAPDGPFSLSLLPALTKAGIAYIGLPKNFKDETTKKRYLFWLGRRYKGTRVITRNAFFEPGSPRKSDWVDSCLSEIKNAFQFRKPAVISTHRANYVDGIEPGNADRGYRELKRLLNEIHRHFPNATFLTSTQLGDMISGKLVLDEYFK